MTTTTHKVELLDAFIEQAVAQWREYRIREPYVDTGNIEPAARDEMDRIAVAVAPNDRRTLVELALDERVWGAPAADWGGADTLGDEIVCTVKNVLVEAMWATDGVS